MFLFSKKLTAEQLQEKIAAFDKRTEELQALREELKGQQANGLAREVTGEQAPELLKVRKQLTQVIADLEGRPLALDRLNTELVEVRRRERVADFAKEKEQVVTWLRNRTEVGKRLGEAIRALSEALASVEHDRIPPSAVFRGIATGYGGASTEREMLDDATKFEPPLYFLAEGIKIIGGIDGGDSLGRKHPYVDHARLEEASTSAEQNGNRLRELVESLMSRYEVELRA